uniref:RRM domain-containing protein n=5 Tax=Triticinae TaxID=1648030 RepID=A0A453P2W1_AEGTS
PRIPQTDFGRCRFARGNILRRIINPSEPSPPFGYFAVAFCSACLPTMALPLVRLLLPSLPACQPPLRHPEYSASPRHSHVSFAVPAAARSSGNRLAFAVCAASASVAPAPAEIQADAEDEQPVGPKTRLIAMNIPWDFTPDDIRVLFEKQGTVVDVELSMHSSKKNRGLAFVTMGSEEEALSALKNLNLSTVNDRTIKVDFAKPKKKQPAVPSAPVEKNVVFVGNLTWRVRSRHLRELFASTPGVQSVEVIFHTTTPRRSAGYAFVSFSSKEEAEAAISTFNGKELMGRSINVMFKEDTVKKNKSSDSEEEKLEEAESSEESDS